MRDVFSDAEARYRDACERRQAVIETWELKGRPLLSEGSTGQLTEHPLMKQIGELDRLCDKLAQPLLPAKKPGQTPAGVVAATLGGMPRTRNRDRRDPRLDPVR